MTRNNPEIQAQTVRNMAARWTVFELAILLHHYSSGGYPFDRASAPAYPGALSRLQGRGLLDEGKHITLRGALFVGMLLNAPVPKEATPRTSADRSHDQRRQEKLRRLAESDDPTDSFQWLAMMQAGRGTLS